MNAIALMLALLGGDDFQWKVDAPSFSWAVSEGGDASLRTESGSMAHDVPGPAQEASGLLSPGSVVSPPSSFTTEPSTITGQCQCQSRGERACYCLRTGNKCYCPTRGPSTWELTETGAPIRKVQNPLRREASAGDVTAPAAAGYPVTSSNGWAYWTDSSGVRWDDRGTGLREGVVYGKRFTYRGGAMHDGSTMAADIVPKKGHWERRCFGNYCRMVWVSE